MVVLAILSLLLGCSAAEHVETTGEITSERIETVIREETGTAAFGEPSSPTVRSGFETTQVAEEPRPGRKLSSFRSLT